MTQTTTEAISIDLPKLAEKLKLSATTTRVSMSWQELQRLADASYTSGFNAGVLATVKVENAGI